MPKLTFNMEALSPVAPSWVGPLCENPRCIHHRRLVSIGFEGSCASFLPNESVEAYYRTYAINGMMMHSRFCSGCAAMLESYLYFDEDTSVFCGNKLCCLHKLKAEGNTIKVGLSIAFGQSTVVSVHRRMVYNGMDMAYLCDACFEMLENREE
jgi:hypothetical protein